MHPRRRPHSQAIPRSPPGFRDFEEAQELRKHRFYIFVIAALAVVGFLFQGSATAHTGKRGPCTTGSRRPDRAEHGVTDAQRILRRARLDEHPASGRGPTTGTATTGGTGTAGRTATTGGTGTAGCTATGGPTTSTGTATTGCTGTAGCTATTGCTGTAGCTATGGPGHTGTGTGSLFVERRFRTPSPVRVGWQLRRQHGQWLLRRLPVLGERLAGSRVLRAPERRLTGSTGSGCAATAGPKWLEPVALMLGPTRAELMVRFVAGRTGHR